MKKSAIIDEVARRCGDESFVFKAGVLTRIFAWVLMELAQEDALSLLNKESSFALNASGTQVSSGLLNVTLSTVLNLTADHMVDQVQRVRVPAWGTLGRLRQAPTWEFEALWLNSTFPPTYTGRPQVWRVFPNPSQLQLWPAPDAESAPALAVMAWRDNPSTLDDQDEITEVLPSDLPTICAGCYRYATLFSDDTLRDALGKLAMFDWGAGVQRMKSRITKAQSAGGLQQIKYKDW